MGFLSDMFKGAGGGIVSGLFGLGSSIIGAHSQNKMIDKQLKAQSEENQKNRDYNLMLAQQQNAWNQEQWERENEYNSPVNQMKRFEEAGLNPDLMYGQGNSGNAAQLSGGLTAGAPSSPMDYSALGQKMTLGQVINQSMERALQMAQIESIRANTQKTKNEAGLTEIELDTQRALQLMTGSDSEELLTQLDKSNPLVRKAVVSLANLEKDYTIKGNDAERQHYELIVKKEDARLATQRADKLFEELCERVKITKSEAEVWVKTTAARVRGIQLDNEIKENDALWNNSDFLKDLPQGLPVFIKLIRLALGK